MRITSLARAASVSDAPSRSSDFPPINFDASACPIIARHWFGVHPFRSAAEVVADLRFRRQVERVHLLGPRVTAELLAEIGAERSIQTVIDQKLDRYAELNLEALQATGGDRFWPVPIHEVKS